jgi:outer membrane protein assembly factor BamA
MTSGGTVKIYLVRAGVLLLAGIVALIVVRRGQAQTVQSLGSMPMVDSLRGAVQWTLRVDGQATAWPGARPTMPFDSLQAVVRQTVRRFRQDGYYYAALDSVTLQATPRPPQVRVHLHRGPRIDLGRIRILGAQVLSESQIRRLMDTEPGAPLDADRLRSDLNAVLARYEEAGYPLAEIRVQELALRRTPRPQLVLTLRVHEGARLWLKRVEVPSGVRTSPSFVAHAVGLTAGAPLANYDPTAIRQALQETGLFREVRAPEMRVTDDGGAVLFVPLEERTPGSFDLVLGYLPPSRPGGSGQVVGTGHLQLRNVFGGGRRATVALDRRPGQASLFNLEATDPYLFGWPLRVHGRFRGEQRDSTYSQRALHLGLGYQFAGGWQMQGTVTREVTEPGFAGAQLEAGQQRIARATSWFYGGGLRYEQVDDAMNPRRGGWIDVQLEQGRKDRRLQQAAGPDTTTTRETLRQERIRGAGRVYVPVLDRHVVVLGGEAQAVFSDAYDRSDLFRLGGASSLRGYEEDRFLGNVVGRLLAEYRLQIDRVSYAFAFTDVGFVHRPDTKLLDADQGWHPGFGFGLQFSTALGVVDVSYALNTASLQPSDGKIHLGLSFDL